MECLCGLTLPDPNLSETWKGISILATLIICVSQKSCCLQGISFLCKEVDGWGRVPKVQAASLLTVLHEQFFLIHPENMKLIWNLLPQLLLLSVSFQDRVSCRVGWSTTCSVTRAILELLNLCLHPPRAGIIEGHDHNQTPLFLFYNRKSKAEQRASMIDTLPYQFKTYIRVSKFYKID